MFTIKNFTDNNDIKTLDTLGAFTVIEYQRDLSVMPQNAALAYYCNEMNVRKRQVICDVSKSPITTQSGAMQWMVGDVNATTGVKGVGDLFGKALRGSVTGESAIKPEYTGKGTLVLEPTYKHILLIDVADWNGSIVLDDGLFLACESSLKHKAVARSNFSSAVAGNEGLFNLGIQGKGILCLESECPREELVEITLNDDVLKVDGNMAIAWSGSLNFTVERSGKSLVGSAASGEGQSGNVPRMRNRRHGQAGNRQVDAAHEDTVIVLRSFRRPDGYHPEARWSISRVRWEHRATWLLWRISVCRLSEWEKCFTRARSVLPQMSGRNLAGNRSGSSQRKAWHSLTGRNS